MNSATCSKSVGPKPREVKAGVPMRIPPGMKADLSPGTVFLLMAICERQMMREVLRCNQWAICERQMMREVLRCNQWAICERQMMREVLRCNQWQSVGDLRAPAHASAHQRPSIAIR